MNVTVKKSDGEVEGYANVINVDVEKDGTLSMISQTSDGDVFSHLAKHEWDSVEVTV